MLISWGNFFFTVFSFTLLFKFKDFVHLCGFFMVYESLHVEIVCVFGENQVN